MKKILVLIILLLTIVLLALADYFVTQPEFDLESTENNAPPSEIKENEISPPPVPTPINVTKSTLEDNPELSLFILEKTTRVTSLFETFTVDQKDIPLYKNELKNASEQRIEIYELQAPEGQGKFAFLALKAGITNQLSDPTQINVTNDYGEMSFFYNDSAQPTMGFLVTQVGDNIFGFKYDKNSPNNFTFIQNFIQALAS